MESILTERMDTKNITLSIIVPAYNMEKYIGWALESVINQDVSPHEIVVVNDGSTDGTVEKVKQYSNLANIRVISTENQGLGRARNEGIKCATGDYIYFFDADDLLDRQFVRIIQSVIQRNDTPELILFSGDSFRESGAPSAFYRNYKRAFEASGVGGDQVLALMDNVGKMSASACLYVSKRSLWKEKELSFKDIVHEDEELFLPLLLSARNVVVLDQILFYRRVRPMSIMTSTKTGQNTHGLFVNMLSSVELYRRTHNRCAVTRKIIRKRSVRFATSYMKSCGTIGVRPNVWRLLYCAYAVRSLKLLRKPVRAYLRAAATAGTESLT